MPDSTTPVPADHAEPALSDNVAPAAADVDAENAQAAAADAGLLSQLED